MNRLQKKCMVATVGIHLLLLLILIVGPGFFAPKPKPNDVPVLDVISANLVDAAINSGVRNAQPPPPAPVITPPQPLPPPPTPVATPAPTPPTPKVETPEPIKEIKEPTLEPKPVEKPVKEHKIEPDLTKVVRRPPKNSPLTTARDESEERARAFASAARHAASALQKNITSATEIDVPGTGSVSYSSYDAVVKSIYERTMNNFLPNQVANDNEDTKVSVTIARDGTVLSSRIMSPSGDPVWDAAVQHTLDRVSYIAPFPANATEKERTYTISFNPQVERSL
jgi:TonB family protein